LDVSASTLRRIAEEQEPITGADFAEWRTGLGLSLTEAAKLLGVGRRTIMGYLKKEELPPVVAIACRALARDKHLWRLTMCRRGRPTSRPREHTPPPDALGQRMLRRRY
jgi:transcriptional regulator with XRE-family HTH domain